MIRGIRARSSTHSSEARSLLTMNFRYILSIISAVLAEVNLLYVPFVGRS